MNYTTTGGAGISDRSKREPVRGIAVVAFDGDDTLWHNESIFSMTQEKFRALLRDYRPESAIHERLLSTETRNLHLFGYGIKGFMLSMIETAIEVSEGSIPAQAIQEMINYGKGMLDHPVELLEGVRPVIETLGRRYRLMVITKGDLFDQESKIARSGLVDLFWKVEIVSEKDEATYHRILQTHGIRPEEFLMVGNSIRSDILPVTALGAKAVHVPYHLTWLHEEADLTESARRHTWTARSIADIPGLLAP